MTQEKLEMEIYRNADPFTIGQAWGMYPFVTDHNLSGLKLRPLLAHPLKPSRLTDPDIPTGQWDVKPS